jgi:hypothetical protein
MRELFEQYIAAAINGELRQLQDVFSEAKRNAFWVVESGNRIVGTFGIETAARKVRSFGACTSIEVIEAAAWRTACCNVLSCGQLSSVFQR